MDIVVKQVGQVAIISVVGSVDTLTAPEVADFLESQLNSGQTRFVLDLSQVDFLSSAGLRVILSSHRKSRDKGGNLRLAAPQPRVGDLLSVTGVYQIVKAFPTVDEAVASFG
jgi:anti-sigma B factor antagonist